MKVARFKKRTRGKGNLFQENSTPQLAPFAKSRREATDFSPDNVGNSLWWCRTTADFPPRRHPNSDTRHDL